MLFREPDRRRGGGRGEHDLDSGFAHDVHYALEPAEIEFTFIRFTEAPGEFPDADNVDASLEHQFGIACPLAFGVFGGSSKREDPLLRMIVNAEIHRFVITSRLLRHSKDFRPGPQWKNKFRNPPRQGQ